MPNTYPRFQVSGSRSVWPRRAHTGEADINCRLRWRSRWADARGDRLVDHPIGAPSEFISVAGC